MALLTLNGDSVFGGVIERPLSGVWFAELDVDASSVPSGRATIELPDGKLLGTIAHADEQHGRMFARVVGGAGGLTKVAAPQDYHGGTLRLLVGELLAAVGERLSNLSDDAVLGTKVARWARRKLRASMLLDELVARAGGAVWRVLSDGTVWVGTPSFPTSKLTPVDVDADALARTVTYATDGEGLDANVTLDGRRLVLVRHHISPSGVRVLAHHQ